MSWSVNLTGTPENVAKALQEQSEKLEGKSKEEFDAALPHMLGLVQQNYNSTTNQVIVFSANGHGWHNGDQKNNTCFCKLEPFQSNLV